MSAITDIQRKLLELNCKICTLDGDVSDLLTLDILEALRNANLPNALNPFVTELDLASIGIGTNIFVVNTHSLLPLASASSGYYYWVENNQGTQWLPGSLGGTYYPKGLYYSNGITWITVDTPINASQIEVNTGVNDNKFVTPKGLKDSTQWSTKSDTGHTHDDRYYTETETNSLLSGKADSLTNNQNYVTNAEKVIIGDISGINTGDNAVNNLYSGLVTNATHTGDATGSTALTLATVNANLGAFGSATQVAVPTVNAKGLITAISNTAIAIPSTAVTDFQSAVSSNSAVTANTAKTGITAGQAANIVTNNAKISYTDAAAVAANTAKNSYPSGDSTKVNHISVTQAVNLDTMESDIATNNLKISFDNTSSTRLLNTSGTNTGDNATNTQYSGLASSKQDTLVSATNIKTINGDSILGSGNIVIGSPVITSVDVNFGTFGYSAFIDIVDATVTISTKLMVSLVGAASGRDFDELEFSPIIPSYVINAGVGFKIYAVAPNGADGIFTINYTK